MNQTPVPFIHVIDDSKDMQELLKILLRSKGYSAEFSSDGNEALDFLRASARLPDLIILDLQMPNFSGREFLREREASPRLRDVPVVVMSGEEESELGDIRELVSGYLRKPISIVAFLSAIIRATSRDTLKAKVSVAPSLVDA